MKKQNGISLIVLIITIIVMLILAAITLNIATDGEFIKKAEMASFKSDIKQVQEAFETKKHEIVVNKMMDSIPTNLLIMLSDITNMNIDISDELINKFGNKLGVGISNDGELRLYYNSNSSFSADEIQWLQEMGIGLWNPEPPVEPYKFRLIDFADSRAYQPTNQGGIIGGMYIIPKETFKQKVGATDLELSQYGINTNTFQLLNSDKILSCTGTDSNSNISGGDFEFFYAEMRENITKNNLFTFFSDSSRVYLITSNSSFSAEVINNQNIEDYDELVFSFVGTDSRLSMTYNLTNLTSRNTNTKIARSSNYTTKLIPKKDYDLPEAIQITMGGVELITETDYNYNSSTGEITVQNVTGNLVITAEGIEKIIKDEEDPSDNGEDSVVNFEIDVYQSKTITNLVKLDINFNTDNMFGKNEMAKKLAPELGYTNIETQEQLVASLLIDNYKSKLSKEYSKDEYNSIITELKENNILTEENSKTPDDVFKVISGGTSIKEYFLLFYKPNFKKITLIEADTDSQIDITNKVVYNKYNEFFEFFDSITYIANQNGSYILKVELDEKVATKTIEIKDVDINKIDNWTDNGNGIYTSEDKRIEIGKTTLLNEEVIAKLNVEKGSYNDTWTIIGVENNQLKLVSTSNVKDDVALGYIDEDVYKIDDNGQITDQVKDEIVEIYNPNDSLAFEKAKWSFEHAIDKLNNVAKKETGINTARSIKLEDLQTLFNIDDEDIGIVREKYRYYYKEDGHLYCQLYNNGIWEEETMADYACPIFVSDKGILTPEEYLTQDPIEETSNTALTSYTFPDKYPNLFTGNLYYWLADEMKSCGSGVNYYIGKVYESQRQLQPGMMYSYYGYYPIMEEKNGVRAIIYI